MDDTKRQSLPKAFGKVRKKMQKYEFSAALLGVGILAFGIGCYTGGILEQKTLTPTKKAEVVIPVKKEVAIACVDRIYTVVPGDRKKGLWGVAEKQYGGRGYLNLLIAEKNSEEYPSLKENPNFIQVGWMLVIPCCICDLPDLVSAKSSPVKNTVKKVVKKVAVIVPEPHPCHACPKAEVLPTPVLVVPPAEKVSLPEAPKPPPAPTPVQPTPVVVPQPVVQPPPAKPPVEEKIVPPAFQSFHGPEGPVTKQPPAPAKPPVEESIVPPEEQSFHGEEGPVTKQPLPPKTPGVLVPVTKQGQEHWSHGETKRLAPGSLWDIVGTSPLERGNWINYFHVDQGILLGRIGKVQIVPYIGLNAVKDTKGYSWNNRVQGEAGVKGVWFYKSGVVEVGTAYAAERRFGKDLAVRTRTGLIGFARGWDGWQLPTITPPARRFLPGTLPGTFQWQVGNISPFERNNVIGSLRADQGFTLAQFGRVSFIPTASIQAWADSDRNPWNRRYMYGGGLRVAIPFKSGTVDFNAGYMCAKQYSGAPIARSNGCGPAMSVSFWKGWGRGQ